MKVVASFSFVCILIFSHALAAELSWPRWRGPNNSGSTNQGSYEIAFDDERNIAWKVPLPGIGCSTPAVIGDQIILTCPVEAADAVLSFDWSGKPLWKTIVGPQKAGKHRNGSGANSSPVSDGEYIFAYFKSGNLAGFDMSGKLLWKTNLQERFAKDTLYWDIGTSPVLTEKACIVAVMHSGESYLAAFDKSSGDLLWKVSRNYKTPVEGDHSYATPFLIENQGKQALLVWGAEHLTAHDVDNGTLLWSCAGFNPQKKGNWVAVASAVMVDDIAVVPYGRGSQIAGIKLGGQNDVTETHRLWTSQDVGSFVPSPAVFNGQVFIVRDEGEVVCLDPQTGKTIWTDRFPKNRNKFYSSPTIANGILYAAREDGVMFVADIREGFKLLAENDMKERLVASPVPVEGKLLIRGEKHLFLVKNSTK